jgi:SAM-dependent methyltransferase
MMDTWAEGDSYERFMGRWSRLVAQEFVGWLDVSADSAWVDVGCGTGALTSAIADSARPARLAGVDPSPGFIAAALERLGGRADLRVGDANSLPFPSAEFDAAVSGLALNFMPDPHGAVGEMQRVTLKGGVVGAYVWDYADGMQMIRTFWDVAVDLDPSIGQLDEAKRFPLCDPDRLSELFKETGLDEVEAGALEVPTVFDGFEEYWTPFLGGQGPAPTYVSSLSDDHRRRLETRLESELPVSSDGVIRLTARAWTVRGVVRD